MRNQICVHGYFTTTCPFCKREVSSPQKQILVTRPMTWDIVGAWIDAEGYADFYYENGTLRVEIIISQANKVRSGYKILEEIRNFIKDELGITGAIYPRKRERGVFRLTYHRILDAYKLAVASLPYLRHPKMIRSITRIIMEIEDHTIRTIAYEETRIPQLPPRQKQLAKTRLRRAHRQLAQIKKIRQQFPYVAYLSPLPT